MLDAALLMLPRILEVALLQHKRKIRTIQHMLLGNKLSFGYYVLKLWKFRDKKRKNDPVLFMLFSIMSQKLTFIHWKTL